MNSYKRSRYCWFTVIYLSSCIWLCLTATMRLEPEKFSAVLTPETRTLARIFEKHGFKNKIRIVGGAVRDLLKYGTIPTDMDFATSVTLEEMREMFRRERLPMLNEKGEEHGTVTVRINRKENFEISVLRSTAKIDQKCRNLSYTQDWTIDARRRDFTINALYLDFEGHLYDYFNGYEDLKNNRVVFIEDPGERIRHDSLLILRYFRFYGKIANDPSTHDDKVLQAIRDNVAGLDKIPVERIWSELQGILSSNLVNELVKMMLKLGLAQYIGLSRTPDVNLDIDCFDSVCRNKRKYSFKLITLIGSLLRTRDEVTTFRRRTRLSDVDHTIVKFIVRYKNITIPDSDEECFKVFQRVLVFLRPSNFDLTRTCIMEFLKLADREVVLNRLSEWIMPDFPVNGTVLMANGIKGSDQAREFITAVKEKWIDNDFVLDNELISEVANEFKRNNSIKN